MKIIKVTALIAVLILATALPVFADDTPEDRPLLLEDEEAVEDSGGEESREELWDNYRTELHQRTDELLFDPETVDRLAVDGIKVIFTGPADEDTVEIGVYPDQSEARDLVLELLVENEIGTTDNFSIVHSEPVETMPAPANDDSGAPDIDEPVDTGEEYDEPADGEDALPEENSEDAEASDFLIPAAAVLGLVALGGGVYYFRR